MINGYIENVSVPTKDDLEKINKYTRREFNADELYVFNVTLSNNDIDRDYERFSVKALEELAEQYIGKTGICDHSMKASNQKARVFDAWVEKAIKAKAFDGDELYELKAKAYTLKNDGYKLFTQEIDAGLKKEVSVSCSTDSAVCSICGKNKRKEMCEHIPGRSYKGKTAYTTLENVIDVYEFSFVAVPAQKGACVTKAYIQERENNMNRQTDVFKLLKNTENDTVITKAQAEAVCRELESLKADAEIGREYKSALAAEVIALCAKAVPELETDVFSSVAQVMTVSELKAFKNAFSKRNYALGVTPQFANGVSADKSVNEYKI